MDVPVEGVDIYVTNKAVDGKTLAELGKFPAASGRLPTEDRAGRDCHGYPDPAEHKVQRGDILTLVGRTQDTNAATELLGVADHPTDVADVAFIGAAS